MKVEKGEMIEEEEKKKDWALGIFGRILYIHLVVGVLVYLVWSYIYACIL